MVFGSELLKNSSGKDSWSLRCKEKQHPLYMQHLSPVCPVTEIKAGAKNSWWNDSWAFALAHSTWMTSLKSTDEKNKHTHTKYASTVKHKQDRLLLQIEDQTNESVKADRWTRSQSSWQTGMLCLCSKKKVFFCTVCCANQSMSIN